MKKCDVKKELKLKRQMNEWEKGFIFTLIRGKGDQKEGMFLGKSYSIEK